MSFVTANSDISAVDAGPSAEPGDEDATQARLTAKERWKSKPGHRYTPEQLKRMSETVEVKIQRRKMVEMQI